MEGLPREFDLLRPQVLIVKFGRRLVELARPRGFGRGREEDEENMKGLRAKKKGNPSNVGIERMINED